MSSKDIYEGEKNLVERGNVDLTNRPKVTNPDGSVSTVRSMSFRFSDDGPEVLIPTVSDDAKILSPDEAVRSYLQTGKHLGKFKDSESATRFANKLHLQQEQLYTTLDRDIPTKLLSDHKPQTPELKTTRERLMFGLMKTLSDSRKSMSQQLIQQKDAELQKQQQQLQQQMNKEQY